MCGVEKIVQKFKGSRLKGGEKKGDGFFSRYRSFRMTFEDVWRMIAHDSIPILPPPAQVFWVINKISMADALLLRIQGVRNAAYPEGL